MTRSTLVLASLLMALPAVTAADPSGAGRAPVRLKAGDIAPPFELQGLDGKLHRLADILREKKALVLVWIPKAFTPS